MNSKDDVVQAIRDLDTKSIKFGVTDIDGVLRGKVISTEKFLSALEHGIGFCNVIFGWDVNDACYDNSVVSGWHTGYPDSISTIDPNSMRLIPWEDNRPFFIGDFSNAPDLQNVCPRNLLKKIIQELATEGLTPKIGAEFEWYNFDESPQSLHYKDFQNLNPLTPGMFGYSIFRASINSAYVNDLFEFLHEFEIPLEGIHTETGDGVYEACIAYSDALESADRAALFKTAVKEIASKHELVTSFMAKWNADLPGCGGHLHQSLWNADSSKNLFYDEEHPQKLSPLFESYIAGQLHCLPYILPLYAPTINSYNRFVEGTWAATTVSWGIDNRTTALRVINQKEQSMRLETRVPGADANPYLSIAASLASGLYGIKNNLKLEVPLTTGNEYQNKNAVGLPSDLHKATQAMKNSEIPKALFGEEFVDHFVRTREWEWRQYNPQQSDWELKRYFEII